jgi:hypothetical protein
MLLFGPSGVGKTHLAFGIVLAQIVLDQYWRFYPATALVQELQKARADYSRPQALERLDHYPLLLIDDIGFLQGDERESSVLFELICQRYERCSLLITANQPFTAWDEIFPSSSMTVAAVDRLVHHCHIVEISGDSHRRAQPSQREPADGSGDNRRELTRGDNLAPISAAPGGELRTGRRTMGSAGTCAPREVGAEVPQTAPANLVVVWCLSRKASSDLATSSGVVNLSCRRPQVVSKRPGG